MKTWRVVFLALFTHIAIAQVPEPAAIHGMLMRWGTVQPVGQATIELRATGGAAAPVAITATNDNGEFTFPDIPIGSYRVIAMADGFAAAEYGQLRQNGVGRPLAVGAGERANIQLGIVPGGIISGRVTDANGQPVVYGNVDILKAAYDASGQIVPVVALSVSTNDLGEYRAFWLSPGAYIVRAGSSRLNNFSNQGTTNPVHSDTSIPTTYTSSTDRPRARAAPAQDTQEPAIAPILSAYFGGSADAKTAQVVDLRAGGDVTGVDVRETPVQFSRQVHIRGVVLDAAGQPLQSNFSVSISSWPDDQQNFASVRAVTTRVPATDPNAAPGAMRYAIDNGKFEGSATSGSYQLRVVVGDLSGRTLIDVSNQDVNAIIPLHPSTTVTGRVRIEGGAPNTPFDLTRLKVGMRTLPSTLASGDVTQDGQFQVKGVIAGDYQVYLPPFIPLPENANGRTNPDPPPLPAGLENAYVKSIRVGDVDVTDNNFAIEGTSAVGPLEIVVRLTGASAAGRVVNARQEPVDRATVVLLPLEQAPFRADRYRTMTTDKAGQYQFRGLPPGDYRMLAWEDVDPGSWFNPAFLAAFERYAMPFHVVEGQRQNLEIAVIPVSP